MRQSVYRTKTTEIHPSKFFNLAFRYNDDDLSLNNPHFNDCIHLVNPSKLGINIIMKEEGLLHILIFSAILTDMDDFKQESMKNVTI